MSESLNSLQILLNLLTPGCSASEQFELLRQLDTAQWEVFFSEADRQGVTPLLYPLLVELENVYSLEFPSKEHLYQAFITTAVRNTIFLDDAETLFTKLRAAGIATAGLKGIYLLENVYGNIGTRSMNDIDILVRKQDLAECIQVFEGLGYKPNSYFNLKDENIDTKHVPAMQIPGGPLVEMHWTLLEEDEPFTIDAQALWQRMMPVKIANVDAVALCVEDLVLHLCLHLTYQHYLQLGLRGLLDIALVIDKFKDEIDWQKLVVIAQSWGSEKATALTLELIETQLNVPIPGEVISALLPGGIEPALFENARSQLFERKKFEIRLTPDLLEMNTNKNVFSKIRIGFTRVFIPRIALARIYNVSPKSPKIVWYYLFRLSYLVKNYGKTLVRLQSETKSDEPALQEAKISYSLHEWMIN